MTIRLTTKTVNFLRPFTLNEEDGERAAGIYVVETEEEKVNFLFFSVFRHRSTMMHREDLHAGSGLLRFVAVDPVELEAALARENEIAAQFEMRQAS